MINATVQFISICAVLKCFFELPTVFKNTIDYMRNLEEEVKKYKIVRNFIQADFWQRQKIPIDEKHFILPIMLYYDDYECNNPLRSHKGAGKCDTLLGKVFTILNDGNDDSTALMNNTRNSASSTGGVICEYSPFRNIITNKTLPPNQDDETRTDCENHDVLEFITSFLKLNTVMLIHSDIMLSARESLRSVFPFRILIRLKIPYEATYKVRQY